MLPHDDSGAIESLSYIMSYAAEREIDADHLEMFVFTESEWERKSVQKLSNQYPYTLHLTAEAELAARQMVSEHPPWECIPLKKDMGKCDFAVLILGFGTLGQQALLRLIMNGQTAEGRMRVIIIDSNAEKLRGRFLHRHSALHFCCDLEFHALHVQSNDYFEFLNQRSSVDYVVVSLGDYEVNRQTALDLCLH